MADNANSGTTALPRSMPSSEVLVAIHARLCKAFPEVAKLFPTITTGVDQGKPWREVFDDYVDRLGDRHLQSLCSEVADLFGMGWNARQFEIVVCGIFGLDAAYVRADSGSARRFVVTLEERLSGQRLARSSASARQPSHAATSHSVIEPSVR